MINIIKKNINLNVRQPNNFQLITAMQNDNETVEITATLYDGNKLYTIDDTVDAIRLSGRCANGAIVDCIVDSHTEHTVTFTLGSNMLASDGDMSLSVVFTDTETNQTLSAYPFTVKVQNAPVGTFSQTEITSLTDYVVDAMGYANDAKESAELAESKATEASNSETVTTQKANDANISAELAKGYMDNASSSAATAIEKANEASGSASSASGYNDLALENANTAIQKASEASYSADIATTKAGESLTSANNASKSASESESYAVGGTGTRENEDSDNAQYYYNQAKNIATGLHGALLPMGNRLFAELPNISDVDSGWTYNITDGGTTTSDFREGEGIIFPEGTDIYKDAEGKWNIFGGVSVIGVKGESETDYRKGNVNITAESIGLDNVQSDIDAINSNIDNNFIEQVGFTCHSYLTADGNMTESWEWAYSDFFHVDGLNSLNIRGLTGNVPSICFYSSSKEFISGIAYNRATELEVTVPTNAVYCRASFISDATASNRTIVVSSTEVGDMSASLYQRVPKIENATATLNEDVATLNEDVASKIPKSAMSNSKVITTKGESVADAYELNEDNSDSYAKSVKNKFDAVNGGLPKELKWNTLNDTKSSVFGAIATTNPIIYSLLGGRKFSEYAIYTFNLILDDNRVVASATLTRTVWETIKVVTLTYIDSTETRFQCNVAYASDTGYRQIDNSNGDGKLRVQIVAYGLVTNNGTILG